MKNNILAPILIVLVVTISCTNEMSNDKILTSNDKEILNSSEYQNLMVAFDTMNTINIEIIENSKDAIKINIVTKKEVDGFFIGLLNPEKDAESIAYLEKIGILNPKKLLHKRKFLFNETIPTTLETLASKYPQFKEYSVEQYANLRETYKKENLAL